MTWALPKSKAKARASFIRNMEGGEIFHYTSKDTPANTSVYMKCASKNNRAINLETYAAYIFKSEEKGVPLDAEFNILNK